MTNSCSRTHFSFSQSFERRGVRRIGTLGDEPLPAGTARVVKPPLGVVPQASEICTAALGRIAGQSGATLFERRSVSPRVDLQEVKHAVDTGYAAIAGGRGGGAEALLKPAERRLLTLVRDHSPSSRNPRARVCQGSRTRGTRREVLTGARLEPHVAAPFARNAALAVELALEQPVATEVATVVRVASMMGIGTPASSPSGDNSCGRVRFSNAGQPSILLLQFLLH